MQVETRISTTARSARRQGTHVLPPNARPLRTASSRWEIPTVYLLLSSRAISSIAPEVRMSERQSTSTARRQQCLASDTSSNCRNRASPAQRLRLREIGALKVAMARITRDVNSAAHYTTYEHQSTRNQGQQSVRRQEQTQGDTLLFVLSRGHGRQSDEQIVLG